MATDLTCGADTTRGGKCMNPVSAPGERCSKHQGQVSSGALRTLTPEIREMHRQALAALGHEGRRRIVVPKLVAYTPVKMSATMLEEYTPIDAKLSVPLAAASEELLNRHDYTIPANVTGPVLDEMIGLLRDEGVPASRMSVLRLQGFHRRTPAGRTQHSMDLLHEALVIDAHTRTETVIDPAIAAFAPVRNPAIPVPEQLSQIDRNNPLIDVPWVSSYDEYVLGDYLWWDKAQHIDLDERTVVQ